MDLDKKVLKILGRIGNLVLDVRDRSSQFWPRIFLGEVLPFVIFTVYIFSKPQDELALDKENLHYIKRSIFPFLSRTTKYKISQIKSIGCGGVYDTDTEFLIRGNHYRNRLEIIFKDNSSKSHDVTIYKKELQAIAKEVLRLI